MNNITINDVVWLHGLNAAGDIVEEYAYARGFGLIAHRHRNHAEFGTQESAISEIHAPGQRPHITRFQFTALAQAVLGIT